MTVTETWLRQRYVEDVVSVEEIAKEAGCTVANIRRYLKKWAIRRGKVFVIGKPAWNSGLTKDDDERLARLAEQRSGEGNPMFGAKAWNAGLSKEVDERVASVAAKLKGRTLSKEHRKRLSDAKLGLRREEANRYVNGRCVWPNGYEVTLAENGYEYTHRLVAMRAIGRPLREDENVHHFDGDKLNNALSNLVVLSGSAHTSLHAARVEEKLSQIAWLKNNGFDFELVEKL